MAKARIAPGSSRPPRPALPGAGSGGSGRVGLAGYLRGVWEELKKVVWPARDELLRMTGIVIATVVIFAALVGGADYILSLGVGQAIKSQAASATAVPSPTAITSPVTAAPLPTTIPTEIPLPTVSP
ncbi:MAG: preprotein translocase subunit SecE [Candidatus Dormiibacterota bacterium]